MFVVGDVKQSIYSFRQAMPKIFIDRKEKYPLYVAEKVNYPGRIVLEKNFRSRQEITDSVNFVFDSIMSKDYGDIEYNEEETLICGATYNDTDETTDQDSDVKYEQHGVTGVSPAAQPQHTVPLVRFIDFPLFL